MPVHEDRVRGVYVKGLSDSYVASPADVYEALRTGNAARAVSSTRMNTESSRSHSIFTFTVQQRNTETGASKSGRLYLVDLAGSEKVQKTGASGQTLEEAKKINKSLSALGMVINALTDGKSMHVPYRDSKLTRILQESLGGNSRTTLIINCSPVAYNMDETISTLRFGMRAKSIKNNARVNVELSPTELRALVRKASAQTHAYKQHAEQLEKELEAWRAGRAMPSTQWIPLLRQGGSLPTSSRHSGPSAETAATEAATATETAHAKEVHRYQQRVQALEMELQNEKLKNAALQIDMKDLKEQCDEWQAKAAAAEDTAAAATAAAKDAAPSTHTREERVEAMLKEVTGASVPLEPLLDLVHVLSVASQETSAAMPLTTEQVHTLEEGLVQTHLVLSQQVQAARIAAQENAVLQQQKNALSDRNTALQQRYDLITNQIGALEHGLRVGDDGASQLAELRQVLDEHSSAHQLNTSTEATHLEQLLAIRSEETAGLTRSLDDLRASHEEQRRALELLSASLIRGEARGPDPAIVQRLLDASWQMEKTRELVSLRLREYERLKEQLMQGLRERSERIVEMEMEVEEMQDHYRMLLQSLNMRVQQRKMSMMERRLEQLTNVQRRLIDQNSTLKRDVALAEKRWHARHQCENIPPSPTLSASSFTSRAWSDVSEPMSYAPRIAKPMRGGGGGSTTAAEARVASPPKPKRWLSGAP